ncbi:MAG: penicillin acylase family protein [Bacteroidota bacterium]
MKKYVYFWLCLLLFNCEKRDEGKIYKLEGLEASVEIIRDQWGVNHIYAQNQHDLFFAQGYAAAKDRLFQFEIWRRQATGTVAELLGERELERDIGTRLFKFRGDMTTEMQYYHEDGIEIITAYTKGVNAYIEEALSTPETLPIEFKILDTKPQKWIHEVVISRHQGLLGNITRELDIGRAVAKLGESKVKELIWFHPKEPDITIDPKIDAALLTSPILDLYKAYRQPVHFETSDILPVYRNPNQLSLLQSTHYKPIFEMPDPSWIGSNNWVVSSKLTEDKNTYMANDPHRKIAVPSLRYMVHLVAPGWNVIGGGEPEIPGVSIGHNEHGAWGLTVFSTDGEDLYVYDLNPENLQEYKYKGNWEKMSIIKEQIPVKGANDYEATLHYSRHGPVCYIDSVNYKAYAVRCAWLEIGGAPYLASLRMDQAKNWKEFRAACNYSHIPGENMIWADKKGNIGWQAVGIAPIRKNFSGLVPIPGDGTYEWEGYLPIVEKPNVLNPEIGFFATANQNVTPSNYKNWDAIGFNWSDPYRGDRINEVLGAGEKLNMQTMKALQTDYLSLPAQKLVPLLTNLLLNEKAVTAREKLLNWDFKLSPESIAAAIYVSWENELKTTAYERFVPEAGKVHIRGLQLKRIIDWLEQPSLQFKSSNPKKERDQFLRVTFETAIQSLEQKLGSDTANWQYGQQKFKHSYIQHALSEIVHDTISKKLDVGPLPKGGNAYTPNATSSNNNQSHGATFRIIVNTGDWDTTLGANAPGQSGDPESIYYKNLFQDWAKDNYFPLYYSREKIDSVQADKVVLNPQN